MGTLALVGSLSTVFYLVFIPNYNKYIKVVMERIAAATAAANGQDGTRFSY